MSSNILWSANDPGGANAIAPVIEALVARGDEVAGVATGPALDIAKTKGFAVFSEPPFVPDLFLAGTSMGDSVDEKIFRTLGSVPSVYVMDFWGNYRGRFSKDGVDINYLPTKVCVIDDWSKKDAIAEGVPQEHIEVTGNPYFDHFADTITRDHEDKNEIVFISQPIRADVGDAYGYDEFAALDDLVSCIQTLPQYRLVLRLHPREKSDKYNTYLSAQVSVTQGSLEEVLSRAGLVVGAFSPVLMQAAVAGKAVISHQPNSRVDNLITNELGLTHKTTTQEGLARAVARYVAGTYRNPGDVKSILPKGATERVIGVIDSLL